MIDWISTATEARNCLVVIGEHIEMGAGVVEYLLVANSSTAIA